MRSQRLQREKNWFGVGCYTRSNEIEEDLLTNALTGFDRSYRLAIAISILYEYNFIDRLVQKAREHILLFSGISIK